MTQEARSARIGPQGIHGPTGATGVAVGAADAANGATLASTSVAVVAGQTMLITGSVTVKATSANSNFNVRASVNGTGVGTALGAFSLAGSDAEIRLFQG